MTLSSAFNLLTCRPLRFGDLWQITAHQFILEVLEYREHLASCRACRHGYFCPCEPWDSNVIREAKLLASGLVTTGKPADPQPSKAVH